MVHWKVKDSDGDTALEAILGLEGEEEEEEEEVLQVPRQFC